MIIEKLFEIELVGMLDSVLNVVLFVIIGRCVREWFNFWFKVKIFDSVVVE